MVCHKTIPDTKSQAPHDLSKQRKRAKHTTEKDILFQRSKMREGRESFSENHLDTQDAETTGLVQ